MECIGHYWKIQVFLSHDRNYEKRDSMERIYHYLFHVLMIMALIGCATKNPANLANPSTEANLPQDQVVKEYGFQVGDVFDIRFFNNPELDQAITVRPDGRISLPLVEELLVVGLAPSALDEIITERYRQEIKDPEITIILRQFAGQKVYVGGEVLNPGILQLNGRMTLLQSIFHAGGFKRSAQLDSVMVIRNNNNTAELYRVDVEKTLEEGGIAFALKPYDVVYVPKTFITTTGDFIDQYINDIIPDAIRAGFNFVYSLNPSRGTRTVIIKE